MIADAVVARSTLEALLGPRELVIEIISAIQERHPSYTRFATLGNEGAWAQTVAYLMALFLDLAAENRGLTADELARIRRICAVRLQQDFDCAAIRGAVRTAASLVRARMLGACRQAGTEDVPFDSLLALLDAFAYEIEDVLAAAMVHGSDRRSTTDARLQLLRNAVDRNISSASELERRASEQGCELLVQRSVVLAADEAALQEFATEFHDSCVVRGRGSRGGSYAVLLTAHSSSASDLVPRLDRLARACGTKVLLIGPSSVGDLYDRYLCASAAVPYLADLGGDQFVICDREVELLALVAALPRDVRQALLRHLLERPLGACNAETRSRMLECLEHNVRFGFKALMVQRGTHSNRKTVYDRRAKLGTLTGRSFNLPDQAILTLAHYAHAIETRADDASAFTSS